MIQEDFEVSIQENDPAWFKFEVQRIMGKTVFKSSEISDLQMQRLKIIEAQAEMEENGDVEVKFDGKEVSFRLTELGKWHIEHDLIPEIRNRMKRDSQ